MGRIPYDIEFLLESILSEDPDTMAVSDGDAEILNSKGSTVEGGDYNWENNHDSIPFYIDEQENVVIFSKMGTHGRMERALHFAARISKDRIYLEAALPEIEEFGCIGLDAYPSSIPTKIYFYGLENNTYDGIVEYLRKNRDALLDLNIRDGIQLCGRLWNESNAVSFWNPKSEVDNYMNLMFDFIDQVEANPRWCAYEFADSRGLYAYTDLKSGVADKDKLTPEELHALQAKKHFKKNKNDYGPEFWEKHGKKAAKGFDYPAKANAALPSLENHIKLKDLVKESIQRKG